MTETLYAESENGPWDRTERVLQLIDTVMVAASELPQEQRAAVAEHLHCMSEILAKETNNKET